MKLTLSYDKKKRPYLYGVTAVLMISFIGLAVVTGNKLMLSSPAVRTILVLARICASVIPTVVWIGAVMIVVLWLALLGRVWRL